jgi:hypothetical protein
LAAERTIAGPPMSIFSIASSSVQPGFATVSRKGYRLTTTRSMVGMSWLWSASSAAGRGARGHRHAPWGAGFHAPVEHLGETGTRGNLRDRQAGFGKRFRGAAGRQELDAKRRKATRKIHQAGLVGDRQ